jgi:hypothetical protein
MMSPLPEWIQTILDRLDRIPRGPWELRIRRRTTGEMEPTNDIISAPGPATPRVPVATVSWQAQEHGGQTREFIVASRMDVPSLVDMTVKLAARLESAMLVLEDVSKTTGKERVPTNYQWVAINQEIRCIRQALNRYYDGGIIQ